MSPTPIPTFVPHNAVEAQQLQLLAQMQYHQMPLLDMFVLVILLKFPLPEAIFPMQARLDMYHSLAGHLPGAATANSHPLAFLTLIMFWPLWFMLGTMLIYFLVKWTYSLIQTFLPYISTRFTKTQEKTYLALTFPSDTSKSVYATEQLYKTIYTVAQRNSGFFSPKKTFLLEIVSTQHEGIRYMLGVPKADADVMHRTLLSYLPGIQVEETPDYLNTISLFAMQMKEPKGKEDEVQKTETKTEKSLGILEFKLAEDFVLPLENQKVLNKHDPIGFLTGNMTKLEKGELIAFQIVTTPTLSPKTRNHMHLAKDTIYQGLPLSPVLFKPGFFSFLPSPFLLLFSPVVWLIVAGLKLLINLPHLVLDPNGPHARSFLDSKPKLQEILNPYEQELSKVVKDKLSQHLFETSIRIFILTDNEMEFDARQTGLVSSFSQFSSQYQSVIPKSMASLPFFSTLSFKKRLRDFYQRNLSDSNFVLSASELSDLYHFPNMDITKTEGMVKSKSSMLPAPRSMKRDNQDLDVIVGNNLYGGEETPVGIRKRDRRQHTYIIGKTGMGKSTIIAGMALQDIKNGKGVAVLDPHGDMVEHILKLIPKERLEDVIYLNPFDKSFPTGLNILRPETDFEDTEEEHRRIAATVMSLFMKITPEKNWGQRMEHVLRNAILTTLLIPQETPETPYISLYTIQKLLTEATYRKTVTTNLTDPILKQFWEKEFKLFGTHQQADLISPLTNKIGEFITDPLSRHILLQKDSTINISEIVNNGKVLLVNLSKGNLGEERSAFFGTIITSLIQLATYARAGLPEDDRKDFFVYIDEFQNFATPHFTELFSEARKYHVFFTPSHQNIAQIDDTKVSKIIKGNSGNFIALKGSVDDEKAMLPLFAPEVEEGQIVNLTPHHFFMKVTNDENEDAFTGITIPVTEKGSKETAESIIQNSRKHYATPREDVQKELEAVLQSTPSPKKPTKPKQSKEIQSNGIRKPGEHIKVQVL